MYLPGNASYSALLSNLMEAGAFDENWEHLSITVPSGCFIDQAAIAFLCAWGTTQIQKRRKIGFYGDEDTRRYLSRMDLFHHLGFDYDESFKRHAESGRFISVTKITDEETVSNANNAICDLVLHQFENAREFIPAMEWAVYEMIDNIRLHSETPVPGVVTAQYYPNRHRLDIAIVDCGRGITASLGTDPELKQKIWGHGDAIKIAMQRGVTRDKNIGQGNGLAGSTDIVRLNRGELHIWTGDVDFAIKNGKDHGFTQIPSVPGTGIFLRLNTDRPVRLDETFIGDSGWSYLNYEISRIDEAGGLRVKDACIHTGGREPAAALRRKIESLLPEAKECLILDFDGVTSATTSFFDELLGRLAKSMGETDFGNEVRIANLSPDLDAMANVAIHQRLSEI